MKLSDLNPGDIFRYEDGRKEFLSGTFMRMDEGNCYINPIVRKHCVFIIDMNTGITHCHADYRKVILISKSENNMENKMGHFVNWKFGVPVKVFQCGQQIGDDSWLLINETENTFIVISPATLYVRSFCKIPMPQNSKAHYELIPHKYDCFSPRYPVCQTSEHTAFCNSGSIMANLNAGECKLEPFSTATLIIDGKTIELSAETTAELKKKLGV